MNDGKDFEADVRHLLSLQGWKVTAESLLGFKKIDAYAEKSGEFGELIRIAVECKDYRRSLSQREVTKIYANYLPLLQESKVDKIVLVTRNTIAPTAKTFVASANGLTHVTHIELLNSLMDFSSYLQGIILEYKQDDVDSYYIKQDAVFGPEQVVAAEDLLLAWLESDDLRPIAILAGYGMGKTTLSRRLAYLAAVNHLSDSRARIPISIRLEQLVFEQSLEGLIAKHFTSISIVNNFNFNIFSELNSRGRFIIFLDGFDEMKQTMSWEVLRYNFQQLNRLTVGSSKVVIGGRPSVFLSEDEYNEALHGKRKVLGVWRRMPNWPDYRELHLRPFSKKQIRSFIDSYTRFVMDSRGGSGVGSEPSGGEIESGANEAIYNLASRPVQLKMGSPQL